MSWASAAGMYTFDTGTWVKQTSSASAPTMGGGMAQFLLGLPTSGSFPINCSFQSRRLLRCAIRAGRLACRSNLTINLGLRWEKSHADDGELQPADRRFQSGRGQPGHAGGGNGIRQEPEFAASREPVPSHRRSAVRHGSNRSAYTTSNKAFASPCRRRLDAQGAPQPNGQYGAGSVFSTTTTVPCPHSNRASAHPLPYVATNNSYLTSGHYIEQSFSHGNPDARGQHSGCQYLLGPEHNLQ